MRLNWRRSSRPPGFEWALAACDVADRETLAGLLAAYPPDAVVYATDSSVGAPALADCTPKHSRKCWRAEVSGAHHLDELLADRPLDAVVSISSASAVRARRIRVRARRRAATSTRPLRSGRSAGRWRCQSPWARTASPRSRTRGSTYTTARSGRRSPSSVGGSADSLAERADVEAGRRWVRRH
ncbi:KR domain-containing protein [Amycolatopsis sp. NPDC049691]|uniref:KR domain-containing protein n=1 Tax=Amycolatopsis sp. NPDC049691 TaxID=3155155 RepID=UPI00341E9E64